MSTTHEVDSQVRWKSFRIPALYFFISFIWIFISSFYLRRLGFINGLSSSVHIALDLLFAFITAGILFILIYRQISKERKAKELWQEREEQLRFLINTMPDFVCYKDAEGRWVEANQFALELFQLQGVSYQGKTDKELSQYSDFYREALLYCHETDQKALQSVQPSRLEDYIPQPDGSTLVFDVVKIPTFYPNGRKKGLVVIGRNITERKEVEERNKALFDQNPDAIASFDVHGNFLSMNAIGQNLIGYSEEEVRKINILESARAEERERLKRYFAQTLEGEVLSFDFTLLHKEGYPVDTRVKTFPIVVNDKLVGAYGIAKDMREQRHTEELLRKSDRLTLVGQLAAGVAHEIRNPLATLSGFVQLLQEQTKGHEHYYKIMQSELDRINFIVSEFMFLAKPHVLNFQQKNLFNILEHVITLANTQAIMNNVQILTKMEPDIPPIYCEENQLKQVFINILKNSIEAIPEGGNILIEMKKQSSQQILLRFTDDGLGISEERLARIGEPFYSTKEKGMGLGLMVSYRIIEAHHGKMSISSKVGKGTTVEVWLPVNKNLGEQSDDR